MFIAYDFKAGLQTEPADPIHRLGPSLESKGKEEDRATELQ